MALRVVPAAPVAANTAFTLVVPGQERWRLLAVVAVCFRQSGGTNARSYILTITDGTTTVATQPIPDVAPDPGTFTVCWTNTQPASSTALADGYVNGALADWTLLPGYTIVGTISQAKTGDAWLSAVAWIDWAAS